MENNKEDIEEIVLAKKYIESKKDITLMFKIHQSIETSHKNKIKINTTNCEYISPTCMIILSSVMLISKEQNKDIKLIIKRNSNFENTLKAGGFIPVDKIKKDTIPFNILQKEEQIPYIMDKLFDYSPLKSINIKDRSIIQSKLYEILNNAITHSFSKFGAVYSGYYNNKKDFFFSVYDLGIGIPESVRQYKKDIEDSKEAFCWALGEGNSTKTSNYPSGLGLTMIEEFRKSNKRKNINTF